jgi:GTP-binding protein HflX
LDEVRESDLLLHVLDISHPGFEDQYNVVNKTLQELKIGDKPTIIIFNKIDAYRFVEKEEGDLSELTKENISLEDLKKSWMSKIGNNKCVFISALNRQNVEELRKVVYGEVKKIHEIRYPYNNFLY